MTKEKIIDNIARLNSETWKDREEVRTEIGKLLSELKQTLEQQPIEDCVSRQAVKTAIYSHCYVTEDGLYFEGNVEHIINELPPVTPTFPKGATNGDMIKAMFPKCCSNMGNFDNGIVVDFMGDLHSFDMEWWNAPYKQGNEKWIPENIPYDNIQEHKVVTQRELICNLNAMNDELQAKLDKIEQIINNYDGSIPSMIKQFSEIQKILEQE